jgi:hypothetical protein
MGKRLGQYEEILLKQIEEDSGSKGAELTVWAEQHEGIHRTIQRLRGASALPAITIYHGASEELYEKTFFLSEKEKILSNIEVFRDDRWRTLLFSYPWVAKFLYKRVKYVPLDLVPVEDRVSYSDGQRMEQMEIGLQLFEIHLEQLIRLVQEKKSHLILVTTPLHYHRLPKKVCTPTTSSDILLTQNHIFSLLQKGDFKSIQKDIHLLTKLSPGNALSFHLSGQFFLQLGRWKEAFFQFEKSTTMDCLPWRSTSAHNAIIRKLARQYDLMLFDFDQFMVQKWGENTLFLDDIYPQDIFYQQATRELARKTKKFLELPSGTL